MMFQEALSVKVLERGMQVSVYAKHLKIGQKQPVYVNAFFSDPDEIAGDLTFEWRCSNSAGKTCEDFQSNNSTELEIPGGFPSPGRYLLIVTAKKSSKSVEDSTVVEVGEEMVPIIEIENTMTSCNPSDGIHISAHVNRLVPKCTLQWISVKDDEDYKYIDLNNLPSKPGLPYEITEEENNLENLSEEIDNDSNFVEKQHDLLVPSSDDGSWEGLQDNSKYLFRLIASCPSENYTSVNAKFTISTADVVIPINQLPILKPLKVNPKSGQAIRSIFSFQTDQPYNSSRPLLYKYGIISKSNKKFYLIQEYDVTNVVTILPFYDESIQTMLEVCDSKSACNFTLGPKVIVKLPNNFSLTEISSLIDNFKKYMFEQDYFNAFTLSSIILQTSRQMLSNNTIITFDSAIKNITKHEIDSFLSATDKTWLLPASSFLKNIKILDNDIRLPQDTLNDILALRDKISEKQNSLRKKQSKSEKLVAPSRKLLSLRINKKSQRIVNEINIDEIKDYLEISELAIKRLTDFERVDTEKQKLKEKLQYYIPRICQYLYNTYKSNVRIELSTFIFDVERISLIRKYNEFMFAPFEMVSAAKLQLGRDLAEKYKRQNGICLGKVIFLEDYFHVPQYVYDLKLYSALSDEYLEAETNNFGIIIEMPLKSAVSSDQTFRCVLWEYGQWDMTKCRTLDEYAGKVKCACRSLGYFSMVPVERVTTTTMTTSSSTLRTIPVIEDIELITQRQHNAENEILTTVVNEQSHDAVSQPTVIQRITSTEEVANENKQYQAIRSDGTSVNSAAVWSISLLSVGIFTLLLGFLLLIRKLQTAKAVQSFQTIEYAKYFDEQSLE